MVTTYKQYPENNMTFLQDALSRGENIYTLKTFIMRDTFTTEQGCILKMKIFLACIEAKATVIDAYIQIDNMVGYLFIICSSQLNPVLFSNVIKYYNSQFIVEELFEDEAFHYVANATTEKLMLNDIPYSKALRAVSNSKDILIALLLEYRALLWESGQTIGNKSAPMTLMNKIPTAEENINILLFQKDDKILSLPTFMIERIDESERQKKIIIQEGFGKGAILCDEIFCIKLINFLSIYFISCIRKGLYSMECPISSGVFKFTMMIPSLFF